ncbi:MAG: histidine phosphatase family protein [Betaproteobacteria bacterium]|jgi:probable phosphoglycerate mutase
MASLILIRHGETVWNTERRMQGHRDSPLTERGVWQARQLGQRLKNIPFSVLYSSDLPRAARTSGEIAAVTGHDIVSDERLRERHFGVFEGLTQAEMRELEPQAYERFMSRDPHYAVPGGESPHDFFARCRVVLEDLGRRHGDDTIAVVTHGLVLDSAWRAATGLALDVQRPVPLVNASLNWFAFDGARWSAGRWGDADHLGPDGVTIFGDRRI